MEHYIETLLQMDKTLKTFKKLMIDEFYKSSEAIYFQGSFCFSPRYQKGYFESIKGVVRVIELFDIDILERNRELLKSSVEALEDPVHLNERETFEFFVDGLIGLFSNKNVKRQVKDRLSILDSEERHRLDEAIHCFLEDCNYSAVAMSVSAIEFRLFSLMISVHSEPNLNKMTLGQLISEYLNNKEKFKSIIPKKYEPLLEHCNTYRIFSVHPKKEKINKSVATSILHMTFQFLLDKRLAQKVTK